MVLVVWCGDLVSNSDIGHRYWAVGLSLWESHSPIRLRCLRCVAHNHRTTVWLRGVLRTSWWLGDDSRWSVSDMEKGLGTLTNEKTGNGAVSLPDWDPGDPSKPWFRKLDNVAHCQSH